MDTRWLEDFLSLAETRNFSRSADIRFTTQPAFSRRIKSLEEWVGTLLFDRNTQPISLTPAGDKFRSVAEEVLRRLFQTREDLRHLHDVDATTIVFAATHGLSLSFFPRWIKSVEETTGPMITRLDSNDSEACIQLLLKGHCHFMLCHRHWPSLELHLPTSEFSSIKVGEDRLLPVCAPSPSGEPLYALPGTRSAPVPYLAYGETSAAGIAVEKMLKRHRRPPHLERVFVAHLAAVLASVARGGRGLAWLPEGRIKEDIVAGCLVPAGSGEWVIPVEIGLFRSRDRLPESAEQLWSSLFRDGHHVKDEERKAKNASA
jgi:DNA-binding transcriptional LysR family regulator